MEKLFVTDLDGTALGGGFVPYARFPDHFSGLLDRLAENGWEWAINTTWDPEGQWDLVKQSALKSRPKFLIGEFGRQIVEVKDGKLIRLQPYCDKNDARVLDICKRKIAPAMADVMAHFVPVRIFYYEHLVQFKLHPSEDIGAFEAFAEKFAGDPEVLVSCKNGSLVFRPAFLNKGLGQKAIAEMFPLNPDHIVIAGDESPDIDMMIPGTASNYICPANAAEKVKEHVLKHDGTIGSLEYGAGIVQAFHDLAAKRGWKGIY